MHQGCRQAQRLHGQIKAQLWSEKRSGHTLADAFKLWLTAAPRTCNEKNIIKLFPRLYPSRTLSDVSGAEINAALADKGAAHAKRILNIVRATINQAKAAGMVADPPKIRRRKAPASRIRWLTPEEWDRLDAAPPWRHRAAPGERPRPHLAPGRSTTPRGLGADTDTKSGKSIGVPLSDTVIAAISGEIGRHPGHVFTFRGQPIRSIKTAWNKVLGRAGIEHCT